MGKKYLKVVHSMLLAAESKNNIKYPSINEQPPSLKSYPPPTVKLTCMRSNLKS